MKKESQPHGGALNRLEKGETANPNGRPKGVPNTATRLRRFLELEMKDKNPVTGETETFTVAELMDAAVIKKAMAGDLAAWEKILDRLEGKPRQSLEVSGEDGGPVKVEQKTTVIQIAFRKPEEEEATASPDDTKQKGKRPKE